MKIVEITASFGRTVQVAPYEPANFHASVKAEIPETANISECFDQLFEMVKSDVKAQELGLRKKMKAKSDPHFPGKKAMKFAKAITPTGNSDRYESREVDERPF